MRCLRDAKPEINLPLSVIESNSSNSSIKAEDVWSVYGKAFDFDELVVKSRVYQSALRTHISRVNSRTAIAPSDGEQESLGSEHTEHVKHDITEKTIVVSCDEESATTKDIRVRGCSSSPSWGVFPRRSRSSALRRVLVYDPESNDVEVRSEKLFGQLQNFSAFKHSSLTRFIFR